MKLVIHYKKDLAIFVKDEMKILASDFKELAPGTGIVEGDYKNLIVNSGLLEKVSIFIGYEKIDAFKKISFKEWIDSDDSFKIECSNREVCIELGRIVQDNTNTKVLLENPDKVLKAEMINDKILLCLELLSSNLSSRGYSIANTEFVTADVARAMVDFSGWNNKGVLLDPFCHEGYIIIEACLKSIGVGVGYFKSKDLNFNVKEPRIKGLKSELRGYAKDRKDLKFAKQHAALAKIFKYLKFGCHDLKDLDYTMKEDSVDFVITALPKNTSMEELFFQLEYIMKKEGVVVLLTGQELDYHELYDFKLINETKIMNKSLFKLVKK